MKSSVKPKWSHCNLTLTHRCDHGGNVGGGPQRRSYVRSCSMGSECTFFRKRKMGSVAAPPPGANFGRYALTFHNFINKRVVALQNCGDKGNTCLMCSHLFELHYLDYTCSYASLCFHSLHSQYVATTFFPSSAPSLMLSFVGTGNDTAIGTQHGSCSV